MSESLAQRLRTFTLWGSAAGLTFFAVYPTTNWLTSLRSQHFQIHLPGELGIPFWPRWIYVYLSMYLLFLLPPFFLDCSALRRLGLQLIGTTLAAGCSFLLVPTTLGFVRVPPAGPLHGVYATIVAIDKPHNLVPSLHVTWSTAIALAVADAAGPLWRALVLGWAGAIALSTLLVHQHHLIDLVVAWLFVVIARKLTKEKRPC